MEVGFSRAPKRKVSIEMIANNDGDVLSPKRIFTTPQTKPGESHETVAGSESLTSANALAHKDYDPEPDSFGDDSFFDQAWDDRVCQLDPSGGQIASETFEEAAWFLLEQDDVLGSTCISSEPYPPGSDTLETVSEEDLNKLVDECMAPKQEPPSSVLGAFYSTAVDAEDVKSQDDNDYDSCLQYSPALTGSSVAIAQPDQQLLESDIDWESVRQHPSQCAEGSPRPPSPAQSPSDSSSMCRGVMRAPQNKQRMSHQLPENTGHHTTLSFTLQNSTPDISPTPLRESSRGSVPAGMALRPFKTFFHLHDMLDTKSQMFKHSDGVVFELFARVVYSSRENFVRKQYFQFQDLFKEQKQFLAGTLSA